MKTGRCVSRFELHWLVISIVLLSAVRAGATLSWDWNDGTLQGWSPKAPFGGSLGVDPSFGNPGGSMFATDTVSGSGLVALAPGVLSGDLTVYSSIRWDEYVPDRGSSTTISTSIRLLGTNGTLFESDIALRGVSSWNPCFVSFGDPSEWTRRLGASSFDEVITNVVELYVQMDTSLQAGGGVESWVDNVTVLRPIPAPGAAVIGTLGVGLVGWLRRRRAI